MEVLFDLHVPSAVQVGDVHALVEQLTGDNARLQREAREAADHLALALSRLEDGGGSGVATLDGQVGPGPEECLNEALCMSAVSVHVLGCVWF